MFKNRRNKGKKYFLLSLLFASTALGTILASNDALIAQIKNIYSDSSDQVAGVNSLMSAVASNDIGGVRFFSKAGPSLVNQKNIGGATALIIAAREKNLEIASLLIENGADVNISDNEGWTALMRAALVGADDIVDLLLSKNADATTVNSVNESAIVLAANSDCSSCLNLMFEKFNFIKSMDPDTLKEQLNEAFVVARNHENQDIQNLLDQYMDKTVKMSMLTKPQNDAPEELGNISINQDNQLDLVTKNKGNFQEQDLTSNNSAGKKPLNGNKGKFRFNGEMSEIRNSSDVYETNPSPTIIKDAKERIDGKKNKFVLISKGPKGQIIQESQPDKKEFKPNDSNAVFLKNSKIDDKPVTDILKSKKFKLQQGPKNQVLQQQSSVKLDDKKPESIAKESVSAPIPPIVNNNFKLLKGPAGQQQSDSLAKQGEDNKNAEKAPIDSSNSMPKTPEKILSEKVKLTKESRQKTSNKSFSIVEPKNIDSDMPAPQEKKIIKFKFSSGPVSNSSKEENTSKN